MLGAAVAANFKISQKWHTRNEKNHTKTCSEGPHKKIRTHTLLEVNIPTDGNHHIIRTLAETKCSVNGTYAVVYFNVTASSVSKIILSTHTLRTKLTPRHTATWRLTPSYRFALPTIKKKKKNFPAQNKPAVMSSPLTGWPKLRNFLPTAHRLPSSPFFLSRHESRTAT
jgi:hypothetical protein